MPKSLYGAIVAPHDQAKVIWLIDECTRQFNIGHHLPLAEEAFAVREIARRILHSCINLANVDDYGNGVVLAAATPLGAQPGGDENSVRPDEYCFPATALAQAQGTALYFEETQDLDESVMLGGRMRFKPAFHFPVEVAKLDAASPEAVKDALYEVINIGIYGKDGAKPTLAAAERDARIASYVREVRRNNAGHVMPGFAQDLAVVAILQAHIIGEKSGAITQCAAEISAEFDMGVLIERKRDLPILKEGFGAKGILDSWNGLMRASKALAEKTDVGVHVKAAVAIVLGNNRPKPS